MKLYLGRSGIGRRQEVIEGEELFRGIFVAGAIGTGKTTGVIKPAIRAIVESEARPGALIIQYKDDFDGYVREVAAAAGCPDRVHVIRPGGPDRLNLFHPDFTPQKLASFLLDAAIEEGGGRDPREGFWTQSAERLLATIIACSRILFGPDETTIDVIRKLGMCVVDSSATLPFPWVAAEFAEDPFIVDRNAETENRTLSLDRSDIAGLLTRRAERIRETAGGHASPEVYDLLGFCEEFLFFSGLDDRVATSIGSELARVLGLFRTHSYSRVLGAGPNEMTCEGVRGIFTKGDILIVNFPQHTEGLAGKLVTSLLTRQFYALALQRTRQPEATLRPAFLVCDEFQNNITLGSSPESDNNFSAVARSLKCGLILATQNPEGLGAQAISPTHKTALEQLFGNLRTQVFFRCDLTPKFLELLARRMTSPALAAVTSSLEPFEALVLRDDRHALLEITPSFARSDFHKARRTERRKRTERARRAAIGHGSARVTRHLAVSTDAGTLTSHATRLEAACREEGLFCVRLYADDLARTSTDLARHFATAALADKRRLDEAAIGCIVLERADRLAPEILAAMLRPFRDGDSLEVVPGLVRLDLSRIAVHATYLGTGARPLGFTPRPPDDAQSVTAACRDLFETCTSLDRPRQIPARRTTPAASPRRELI